MRTPMLVIVATSVGLAQAPQQARSSITPGTFVVGGVSLAAEHGEMKVPANRAASSPLLTLRYVRLASTAESPRSPIVFLAGGPGDSGIRAVAGMPMRIMKDLLAIADVVALDQRGTGSSEPMNAACPPGPVRPRDMPADPGAMLGELRSRVRSCLSDVRTKGIDVTGLTTAESADDLEALGRALGARHLTLLAGSYGTHLALATARRHPALVERMALAGVEGPDDTLKLPSRVEAVLKTAAAARRPSLVDDVNTLRARLAAEPARFTFPTGQTIVLGEWDLQRWISESLDAVPEIDSMVAAIGPMLDGDYAALGRASLRYRVPRPINLMNLSMDCASYASPTRLARIATEARTATLGDAINFPLPGLCDVPGLPRLPASYREPIRSNVPALLISGTLDGRTPVQNASDAARAMPRARTLVIEGASHGLFREAAAMRAILEFFRE